MSTKEAEPVSELRCSECEASLDWCAFCDEPGCPVAVCYGCMIVALGQTAPQARHRG
jgi:hypothetical protein